MKTYTTFQACKMLNIKRETLQDWLTRGFVSASVRRARGVGTKNIFSKRDFDKIKLFIELKTFGFSRKKASETVKKIKPGFTISTQHFTLIFYEKRKHREL